MKVLKFGGSSVANAKRFIRVADIIENNKIHGRVAVVLSAPENITNYLVLIIDRTINGVDILKSVHSLRALFDKLIYDITELQSGFNLSYVRNFICNELKRLKELLYGVKLLNQCPDSINADIICLGEKLSIIIMEGILIARGYSITVINPVEQLLAKGNYLSSVVDIEESSKRIQDIDLPVENIILMAGFTAGNEYGELVVLGRNGSDYSAAVLAACLRAVCCEIWTDVNGVYTCDPNQVPSAKLLHYLSYKEAMELSYFGAKVLHPKTIMPIAQFQIPCLIKNIDNVAGSGTLIGPVLTTNIDNSNDFVKGITYLNDMSMINVSGPGMKGMVGMAARVFAAMSRVGCSVVLITQSSSEYSISFCIPQQELYKAHKALDDEFYLELKNGLLDPVDAIEYLSIISVVGDGMRTKVGLSNKLFSALFYARINIIAIAQGSSERSISVVINNKFTKKGIRVAHQMLFNTDQIIEVFIIGAGGVGSALIEQIRRQYSWLKNKNIDLRICGIANSRSMLIDKHAINLTNWRAMLMKSNKEFSLDSVISFVKNYCLVNPVIVDCTSSTDIAYKYVNCLFNGFHVVTPNKKANTVSMEYYNKIRVTAIESQRKFLYDTNVGAGLPVIENLQNLLSAGDELISFVGILSGSLSFIFGKLDEGMSFSEATYMACSYGYTEPDPRDDLSGMDVARKLLILAREAGYTLELQDINVHPVLPVSFDLSGDVKRFLSELKSIDHYFDCKQSKVSGKGCVLRYVGSIQDGHCQVGVQVVDGNNPLFKVKDGENALAFFTKYYQPLPFVLRGYGAGNEVTAAGVFADILRTLSLN